MATIDNKLRDSLLHVLGLGCYHAVKTYEQRHLGHSGHALGHAYNGLVLSPGPTGGIFQVALAADMAAVLAALDARYAAGVTEVGEPDFAPIYPALKAMGQVVNDKTMQKLIADQGHAASLYPTLSAAAQADLASAIDLSAPLQALLYEFVVAGNARYAAAVEGGDYGSPTPLATAIRTAMSRCAQQGAYISVQEVEGFVGVQGADAGCLGQYGHSSLHGVDAGNAALATAAASAAIQAALETWITTELDTHWEEHGNPG